MNAEAWMADQVRVRIDLSAGSVEVDAPLEAIDSIFTRLESFIPQVAASAGRRAGNTSTTPDKGDVTGEDDGGADDDTNPSTKTASKKRGAGKSKETYKLVQLGMDEAKRAEFRTFYSQKDPKGQNDQTLVVMYALKAKAGRESPTKDEIFSGFRTIPDLKVPGKISSVLGNLVGGGFVTNVGTGKYQLTHVGEDRVKLELPAKAAKK